MNHLQKMVLLSDTQALGEMGFQWTKLWKRRTISQQWFKEGLLVFHAENRLFAKGTLSNMRKQNIKNFLHEWSCLSNDDEYAAHQESSQSIINLFCFGIKKT